MIYEAANVMWKYHRLNGLPRAELDHAFGHLVELIDEFVEGERLVDKAISLACELNHPVYDAVYLAACQNWQATLLTLDAKLALAAAKIGVRVVDLDVEARD